jgi:hypothetical protein
MAAFSGFTVSPRALQEFLDSSIARTTLDHAENTTIGYSRGLGSADLGMIEAPISKSVHDLVIRSRSKRVGAGGEARFRIETCFRNTPASSAVVNSGDALTAEDIVRGAHAHIELLCYKHRSNLAYSVSPTVGDFARGDYVDIVIPIPADATEGSTIVLRRFSVAGSEMTLGEPPVQVIVGFNHEPAPLGRVYAAANAGDIPALTQSLDDGCSTMETDGVGVACSIACKDSLLPVSEAAIGPAKG